MASVTSGNSAQSSRRRSLATSFSRARSAICTGSVIVRTGMFSSCVMMLCNRTKARTLSGRLTVPTSSITGASGCFNSSSASVSTWLYVRGLIGQAVLEVNRKNAPCSNSRESSPRSSTRPYWSPRMGRSTLFSSSRLSGCQSMSKHGAASELGPFSSTSIHHWLVVTAMPMWLGTKSVSSPMPCRLSSATSASNSSGVPISGLRWL